MKIEGYEEISFDEWVITLINDSAKFINGDSDDIKRDKFLISKGWKGIRIKSTDEDIIKCLNQGGLKL